MLIAVVMTTNIIAQDVSYIYKALAPEGCTVSYNVSINDSISSIIVTVSSDRMSFLPNPTMKIRTFGNEVIELEGVELNNRSSSGGVVTGNIVIPYTEIYTMAMFPVSPEQLEKIGEGIAKIRISLVPMNHERTFKKDLIGKKIYQLYLQALKDYDNF